MTKTDEKELVVKAGDLQFIETIMFRRLQELEIISQFDTARLRLKLNEDDLSRALSLIEEKTNDAKSKRDKIFKALTRA